MSTDAGVKLDQGKLDYSLVDPRAELELVKILTFGAQKYTRNGWRSVPNGEDRYYAALRRHLESARMGEAFDKESGLLHLAHAYCNLHFLLALELDKLSLIDLSNPRLEE